MAIEMADALRRGKDTRVLDAIDYPGLGERCLAIKAWVIEEKRKAGTQARPAHRPFDLFARTTMSHICRECGNPEEARYIPETRDRLIAESLCFNCDHWLEKVAWKESGDPACVRIDGTHYKIGEEPKQSRERGAFGLGFGGSEFRIRFFDGREVVTHNLWCQGNIPPHFRERLPDNAELVRESCRV